MSDRRNTRPLALLLLLSSVATADEPPDKEAVKDFIVANELSSTSVIRRDRKLSYTDVNDNYIIANTLRKHYLFEFKRRCRDLTEDILRRPEFDFRSSKNIIRAREDTYRGCRIDKIYELTEAQAREIGALGDAPGDGVYLNRADDPDRDQDRNQDRIQDRDKDAASTETESTSEQQAN